MSYNALHRSVLLGLLGLWSAFFLAACNERVTFNGDLDVHHNILIVADRDLIHLDPGAYSSQMQLRSRDTIRVSVNLEGGRVASVDISIKGEPLPKDTGYFSYTAEEIGQSYDLDGYISMEVLERGPTQVILERCGFDYEVRRIEYHNEKYEEQLDLYMIDRSGSKERLMADFQAYDSGERRVITHTGPCQRY